MRIEEYTRELVGDEYVVVGSCKDWHLHDSARCNPIKMSLTCIPGSNEPYYDNLEELILLADSDMLRFNEGDEDFRQNYADIIRGNLPDWQLGAFQVFVGGIELHYGNTETGATGFLWIIGAKVLRLTFQTPQTRLGFNPTYDVYIRHNNGKHCKTEVIEDLGYLRRKIDFRLTNPNKQGDGILHSGNQTIRVVEYAGV